MLKTRVRFAALAASLLTTLGALPGCAPDDQASDFVVTSDLARGRLATIEYANGDRVIFSGSGEDGITIAAIYRTEGGSPLDGIDTERLVPSDVFTYLTGLPAPDAFLAAERAAEITSDSEAAVALPRSDVGGTAQALTAEEFRPLCDGEICVTNQTEWNRVDSDRKVRKVRVIANVVRGGLEVRIRCWDTGINEDYDLTIDSSIDVTHTTGAIRRSCFVVASPTVRPVLYHLSIDFDKHR